MLPRKSDAIHGQRERRHPCTRTDLRVQHANTRNGLLAQGWIKFCLRAIGMKVLEITIDCGSSWQRRGCIRLVYHDPRVFHWARTANYGEPWRLFKKINSIVLKGTWSRSFKLCQCLTFSKRLESYYKSRRLLYYCTPKSGQTLTHSQPEPWIHFLPSECCIKSWGFSLVTIVSHLLVSSLVKLSSTDRMVFCKI